MREKILLVDDEPDVLDFLKQTLSNEGFDIVCASGGQEALDVYEQAPADLVITDMAMSGMSGLEVIRRLQRLDEKPEVIVLTGHGTIENAVEALKGGGAFDYLNKPLADIDDLVFAVQRALDKRRLRRKNDTLVKKLTQANAELVRTNGRLTKEMKARKRAQSKLTKAQNFTQCALNAFMDIFFIVNKKHKLLHWNNQLSKISGYHNREINDKPITTYFDQGGAKKINAGIQAAMEEGHATLETTLIAKNGDRVDYELNLSRFGDFDHNRQCVCGVGRDLSFRKQVESERLEQEKLQAVVEMAGAICHEFSQPMQIITGFSELLMADSDENISNRQYLMNVIGQVDRLAELNRKLLHITRYELRDYPGDRRIFDLEKASNLD